MTVEDQIIDLQASLDALTAKVEALTPAPAADLAPILEALKAIEAQLAPTPTTAAE